MNPLVRLGQLGQSPWYDFITRDLIHSGELARLIREDGLLGMTSNPAIFEKALLGSDDYDQEIRSLTSRGESPDQVIESLMVSDVQAACDVFRPVYEASSNGDGCVSLEVPPSLAHDTEGTISAVKRIWARVNRPNLMIKIPGTAAGIPAIEYCLGEGININITLLFAVERYQQVAQAFLNGLEKRLSGGHSINRIHSVASFFISRIDGLADQALAQAGAAGATLKGRIAIANAIRAYQVFEATLHTPRWQKLALAGAHPQRLLWASTSTKDPSLPDTWYLEALIAPQTVNTIPPATWTAYLDHGNPAIRIDAAAMTEAETQLKQYQAMASRSLAEITAHLEEDGVTKFTENWLVLVNRVKEKSGSLAG